MKQLLRLTVAHVCMHGAMSGLRVAGPLLALKLGHSAFEVGLLFSMFSLSQVFLSLHAGRLADRVGFRSIVLRSVAVCILSIGLALAFPQFWAISLASIGSGGAVGYALIALQRHAGRIAQSPTELKQVFSWLGVGPAISNFVGPVIAGFVIDHFGFRAAFAVLAALPLVTWALVKGVRDSAVLPPVLSDSLVERKWAWDLLADPRIRRLLVINWVLSSCWDIHAFMAPVLGHSFGFSASTIGTIVGCFAFAATTVRLVLPSFVEHLVEWKVISAVCLATGGLLVAYPFLSHPVMMGLGSLSLGAVLGLTQPMMLSSLHQITPEHRRGEALGIRMAVTNTASVVMPLAFGAAGAAIGVKAVFWSLAGCSAVTSHFARRWKIAAPS